MKMDTLVAGAMDVPRPEIVQAVERAWSRTLDRQSLTDDVAMISRAVALSLPTACWFWLFYIALEPYLRVYTADIQPRLIQEFLLFNEDFPRSIRFSTARIEEHLRALAGHGNVQASGTPERLAGRLSSRLRFADLEETASSGAGGLLATVSQDCGRIHEAIYGAFVAYPVEQHLPT